MQGSSEFSEEVYVVPITVRGLSEISSPTQEYINRLRTHLTERTHWCLTYGPFDSSKVPWIGCFPIFHSFSFSPHSISILILVIHQFPGLFFPSQFRSPNLVLNDASCGTLKSFTFLTSDSTHCAITQDHLWWSPLYFPNTWKVT